MDVAMMLLTFIDDPFQEKNVWLFFFVADGPCHPCQPLGPCHCSFELVHSEVVWQHYDYLNVLSWVDVLQLVWQSAAELTLTVPKVVRLYRKIGFNCYRLSDMLKRHTQTDSKYVHLCVESDEEVVGELESVSYFTINWWCCIHVLALVFCTSERFTGTWAYMLWFQCTWVTRLVP